MSTAATSAMSSAGAGSAGLQTKSGARRNCSGIHQHQWLQGLINESWTVLINQTKVAEIRESGYRIGDGSVAYLGVRRARCRSG